MCEVLAQIVAIALYRIHANLLLGAAGQMAVGFCGLLLCGSIVSGLAIWWPKWGRFARGFRIKRGASQFRLTWDLHKATGVTAGVILTLIAFTGAGAAFPETLRTSAGAVFALDDELPTPPLGMPPSLQAAADAALQLVPNGTLMGVQVPRPEVGAVTVILRRPGEPMRYSGQTRVLVGPSGRILTVRDARRLPVAASALDWIFPLHTGEAFATAGRVAVCLAGPVPLLLFTTGLLVWRYKRHARRAAVLRVKTTQARRQDGALQ